MVTLLADFGIPDAKVSIGMEALDPGEAGVQAAAPEQGPGPRKPSDLRTKNVAAALMEQYLTQLYVHHAKGRAVVAQQLHAIGPRYPAIASLGVGVLVPG